ncbi:anhydro-N-acetylmuramic acid kinase [Aquimarina sp. AD1]|uniref:anhydro-N-acetylmuramic acid kinase n=1 Tax=Aquimarina sp. (strain AD1) TaxID=1714848 RepID=UPI000E4CDB60|nr:anhydro-N-acetylmuramic acid kinase [Aquimarina sp. AD1]AXT55960.1 anhydro-N-acetylmuramic acid kinase [Aquimarina sp. AD1]RKN13289.1 anhydro-N-acetylmuramic acid kinase [Aquimarina sp. AD1]
MSTFYKTYKVIGLMSGTSLDGLDIAYCHIKKHEGSWTFSIVNTENIAYSEDFKNKLKNTVDLPSTDLLAFHNTYGTWLGKQVAKFINKNSIAVDFISSHGHTVFHQPEIGLTYQIGSGQHIANTSNLKVIYDFRTNDVALGGQGAPLVPIGDRLLFNKYDFCLNLGGISNISFDLDEKRIAYDISPANMLLNLICNSIDLEYDDGGKIARTGELIEELYNTLNDLSYYKDPYPKSLGYEWFLDKIVPIIEKSNEPVENLLYTSVHHITEQITNAIKNTGKKKSSILVTGGGAKNDFLIETLKQKLQNYTTVIIPEENVIDYKEALIFAFMGVLRELNEVNCLQSVTGAKKDSSSGIICYPQ